MSSNHPIPEELPDPFAVAAGSLSVVGTNGPRCEVCGQLVHPGRRFCSQDCSDAGAARAKAKLNRNADFDIIERELKAYRDVVAEVLENVGHASTKGLTDRLKGAKAGLDALERIRT